nr:hypothetical protein [Tanacetum cinerariifolium]
MNREAPRRTVPVEDTASNALLAQCAYKAGLASVEARLEVYKKNEAVFKDDIIILKLDVMLRDKAIIELRQKFEKAKKRDDLKLTLEKFKGSSRNLSRLLDNQQSDKSKTGLGYDSQGVDSQVLENKVSNSEDEDEIETESKQIKPSFAKVKFVKSTEHVKSPKKSVKQEESNRQTKYLRKTSQSPRVLTNSGLKTLNNVRHPTSRAAVSVNTARPINTAYPRLTVNEAVVSAVKGNGENAIKSSACWIWRPTRNVIDHISKDSESYMLKRFNYVDLQSRLNSDQGIFDSGCSRHIALDYLIFEDMFDN